MATVTGSAFAQHTEIRKVESFSGIRAQSGLDVYLKKGDRESVRVEIGGNIEPKRVLTQVSDGTLKIGLDKGSYNNIDVKVYVTYVSVERLTVNSGATIFCENVIKGSSLTLSATSAGSIEIRVEVGHLEASAGSAGEIELRGKAETAVLEAATAGEIDAYEMLVEKVKVKAATGGEAKVHVVKEIEARAATGGDIRFRGNPERSNTASSTGGSVKKSN